MKNESRNFEISKLHFLQVSDDHNTETRVKVNRYNISDTDSMPTLLSLQLHSVVHPPFRDKSCSVHTAQSFTGATTAL